MADIDIGAGITMGGGISFGSGSGGGGGVTTYTVGVDFSAGGTKTSDATLRLDSSLWSDPAEFAVVVAKPAGTAVSVLISGYFSASGTLLSGFVDSAGLWSASVFIPGAPPGPLLNCDSITI
jgi:hypothetical protein